MFDANYTEEAVKREYNRLDAFDAAVGKSAAPSFINSRRNAALSASIDTFGLPAGSNKSSELCADVSIVPLI